MSRELLVTTGSRAARIFVLHFLPKLPPLTAQPSLPTKGICFPKTHLAFPSLEGLGKAEKKSADRILFLECPKGNRGDEQHIRISPPISQILTELGSAIALCRDHVKTDH